jgi:hypothetical protein
MHEQSAQGPATGPTPHQLGHGLPWVAVVLALAIGIPAVLVVAWPACGCLDPADLVVVNRSPTTVMVDWRSPGLLGTPLFGGGGHLEAAPCLTTGFTLRSGAITATVGTGTDQRTLGFVVPDGRTATTAVVVIDPQGRVGEPGSAIPADAYAEGGLCR